MGARYSMHVYTQHHFVTAVDVSPAPRSTEARAGQSPCAYGCMCFAQKHRSPMSTYLTDVTVLQPGGLGRHCSCLGLLHHSYHIGSNCAVHSSCCCSHVSSSSSRLAGLALCNAASCTHSSWPGAKLGHLRELQVVLCLLLRALLQHVIFGAQACGWGLDVASADRQTKRDASYVTNYNLSSLDCVLGQLGGISSTDIGRATGSLPARCNS